MLRAVITFCLNYRLIVLLLAAGLLVSGVIVARNAPWDVFPEFAPPQIVVQTEAPGLSTEEVEQLVTAPVESAINGVYGLETLRSSSVPGLSVITAVFAEGTEILNARQMVNERLVEAKRLLPEIAEAPQLTPLKTSVSRLATIGLTSETVSPRELRTLADWTLRRRLLAIRGIAQVEIFGGEVKQYQVLADPERLWQYNITLAEVIAAAQSATGFGGAGYVETQSQRLPVRQRTRIETTEDLAAAPVAYRNGAALTLGQVADVQIGSADEEGGPGRDFRGGPEINWDATVLIVNAKVGTGRNLSRNAKLRGRSQLSEPGARLGMFELRAGHWPCNHATLKCRRGRRAEVHDRASSEPAEARRRDYQWQVRRVAHS
jgi:Cu/Ag efflux pump CusA